jgi:hypothetical protein
MYGLVNQAMEDLVVSKFGQDTWTQICRKAGIEIDVFVSNESYDDTVTYRLAGAATEITGLKLDDILYAFGIHWVTRTASDHYGELLDAHGANLAEFLDNLPNFHTRVKLIFPELQPPTFKCTDVRPGGLHLHYFSHRHGLAPFVHGIVAGLGERYRTEVTVTQIATRADGDDHDIFAIVWPVTSAA